jgi:hypothetical protein
MSYTYRAGVTLSTDAGTFTSYTSQIVSTGIHKFSETAINNDDTVISLAIDESAVKAFGLKSSQDVTFKVNDDGSPDATITLTANKPVVWVAGDSQYPSVNPLGIVDATSLTITNDGDDDATVEFACLYDVTP